MTKKLTKAAQIKAFIELNPTVSSGYIAEKFGAKSSYVSTIKWHLKKQVVGVPKTKKVLGVTMGVEDFEKLTDEQLLRVVDGYKKPKRRMLGAFTTNKSVMKHIAPQIPVYKDSIEHVTPKRVAEIEMFEHAADPVNHPEHYKYGGIETIDFIEAKGLGYHLGNVVKYISRAGKKGTNQGMDDLRKAQWYLNRAIEKNEVDSPTR